jgi:hypothetical protein
MNALATSSNVETNDQVLNAEAKALVETESLTASFRKIQNELGDLLSSCSIEGWDGYDARPLILSSFRAAYRFLSRYPRNWPIPQATVDPDGEVAFEWTTERGSFSISFEGSYLSFAGITGSDETHGKSAFNEFIPEVVLNNIRELFTQARTEGDRGPRVINSFRVQ